MTTYSSTPSELRARAGYELWLVRKDIYKAICLYDDDYDPRPKSQKSSFFGIRGPITRNYSLFAKHGKTKK